MPLSRKKQHILIDPRTILSSCLTQQASTIGHSLFVMQCFSDTKAFLLSNVLKTLSTRFERWFFFSGLLHGGARENLPGSHSFDLYPTPFRFTPYFGVEKHLHWGFSHTYNANLTARSSWFYGQSFNGYLSVFAVIRPPSEEKKRTSYYVTLQFND